MRRARDNCSGQVLILAALAIALIISATILYVYQTSRVVPNGDHPFSLNGYVRNVKLGSRNLMIGSLANISQGGDIQILQTNLERWVSFVESQYHFGKCSLNFELCENSPYSSGVWTEWGSDGSGVTSAEADFSMNLTDKGAEMKVAYAVNVTTSIGVSAVSRWLLDMHYINVTISVYNEGELALAHNVTVYYEWNEGGWVDASTLDSYVLTDHGNGTYLATFEVRPPRTYNRGIRVHCYDRRVIYAQTSTTCTDI